MRSRRLTVIGVLRDGVSEILDLERGTVRTVLDLLLRPGHVVRGYWDGHTRPWVNPAKFFLLSFAVAQFVAWQTGALLELAVGFLEGVESAGIESPDVVVRFLADYAVVLVGAAAVLPVIVATLSTRRTLAEITVMVFYLLGQLAVLATGLLLLGEILQGLPAAEVVTFVTPVYLAWAFHRLFGLGPVRTVAVTIAFLVGIAGGVMFAAGVATGAAEFTVGG